jgi:adenylosuccinate lyase
MDWEEIRRVLSELCGKGFKGAVGTGASFGDLLGIENLNKFEDMMSERLELPFFPVTTQTYPRKQDYKVVSALAGLGASLYKFAFDLRILQSPPFGELSEPFGERQVGSSAMPFKRNPETAEKIDSLGRLLAQYPRLAWDNASHSLLERTLDDSANRRSMLPEVFLITDELLISSHWIIEGLQVNKTAIQKNLDIYAPFSATEPVLMALTKKGADRQEMHERIRQHAQKAWTAVQNDQPNPLHEHIIKDKVFLSFLSKDELENVMEAKEYIGDAPQRARDLADKIIESLDK